MKNFKTKLISYLNPFINQLSEVSRTRLKKNPLRILDTKNEQEKQILKSAPKIEEFYTDDDKNYFLKVQQYINELESEKAKVIKYVRKLILENLPKGIKETMDWGMINYEIPLSTYPKTYNKKPLSVMSLAAQKHHFALYLHGVYCDKELYESFSKDVIDEVGKLDMGKSCLRFKKVELFPEETVSKVVKTITPKVYIECYERYK